MVFAVTSAVACGHCLLRPPFVGKLGPEEVASVPVRGLQGAGGGGGGRKASLPLQANFMQIGVPISALSPTCLIILGKTLLLSGPQFPHLCNGELAEVL